MSNQKYKNDKSIYKNKNNKKIILNTAQDLLKISKEDFDKINVSYLYGDYFNQIYKEALEIEKKNIILEDSKKLDLKKNQNKNYKSKYKTNYESPNSNNYNYNIVQNRIKTSPNKNININSKNRININLKSSSIKEKNKVDIKPNYIEHENNINNNRHLFSPEIPPKLNPFEYNELTDSNKNLIYTNNIFGIKSPQKILENNLTSYFDEIKKNERKKLYISMLEKAYKNGNNYTYNTKIKNDEFIDEYNSQNKKFNKNHKNSKIKYKIKKIKFCIRYDSNYGDNIGILGSIDELGNWSQDKIFYLKWNKGNLWIGELEIKEDLKKFEFKVINRNDGIIYWEKGYNYLVDLKSLIHELKFQKKGRYNKYEYRYDEENNDLKLICKVKEWE